MKKDGIRFKIISNFIDTGNIYQTAKKLKISTPLAVYHVKKFKELHFDQNLKQKLQDISVKLIPILENELKGLDYAQADFFIQYLFYYAMNEFKQE